MQRNPSRFGVAVLLAASAITISGCYVHRSGWFAVREPVPGRLSRSSPIVWFSFESGMGGRSFDPQHGRMRAALIIALQHTGAIVVDPGTTEAKHLELFATLSRSGEPSTAAVLANMVAFGLTLGLVPWRETTTLELAVRARSEAGQERNYAYRERITIWRWLPALLLPAQDPVYADEAVIPELAGTVVANLQADGFLPAPVAAADSLRLSWRADFSRGEGQER